MVKSTDVICIHVSFSIQLLLPSARQYDDLPWLKELFPSVTQPGIGTCKFTGSFGVWASPRDSPCLMWSSDLAHSDWVKKGTDSWSRMAQYGTLMGNAHTEHLVSLVEAFCGMPHSLPSPFAHLYPSVCFTGATLQQITIYIIFLPIPDFLFTLISHLHVLGSCRER